MAVEVAKVKVQVPEDEAMVITPPVVLVEKVAARKIVLFEVRSPPPARPVPAVMVVELETALLIV